MRLYGEVLIQDNWCFIKRGNLDTDMHREKAKRRDTEKTTIYRPRRKAQNRSFPCDPQKELTLPMTVILDLQPPDL